jgi:hypothetical protein
MEKQDMEKHDGYRCRAKFYLFFLFQPVKEEGSGDKRWQRSYISFAFSSPKHKWLWLS